MNTFLKNGLFYFLVAQRLNKDQVNITNLFRIFFSRS